MTTTNRPVRGIDAAFAEDFVRRFIAGWNSHDPARLTELCHPDVLWEDPFIVGGPWIGAAAVTYLLTRRARRPMKG